MPGASSSTRRWRAVRAAAAPVHDRAARLDPQPPCRAGPARRHRRPGAESAQSRFRAARSIRVVPFAEDQCREADPPLIEIGAGHMAACWKAPLPLHARTGAMTAMPLLRVENLVKHFPVRSGFFGRAAGAVHAVDGVSFDLPVGETLALVGESGCGKSTVGRLLLRLHRADVGPGLVRRARICSRCRAKRCGRSGARCRSSSRIRSPRSTRG